MTKVSIFSHAWEEGHGISGLASMIMDWNILSGLVMITAELSLSKSGDQKQTKQQQPKSDLFRFISVASSSYGDMPRFQEFPIGLLDVA